MIRETTLLLLLLAGSGGKDADRPHELHFRAAGEDYAATYVPYDPPRVLDLEAATGAWDTPWNALLSYHAAMLDLETIGELRAHQRRLDGSLAEAYMEDEALVQAAREVFSGDVVIHGEVDWEDTTIYLYRYEKGSVPTLSGMPFRRYGDDYCLVKDLTVERPLFRELSIANWDVPAVHARLGFVPVERANGFTGGAVVWVVSGSGAVLIVLFFLLRRAR